MSLDRMLQVLLPQPGDDLRSWASSLVAQLQFLLQQQANDTQMLSSAPATAPLYQSDGNTLVITDVGEYKLADGTVIVDATGLHVKDATGFDVINGPTIRIDTQHLVDAAIETAKLAAGAVTNTIIADNSISTGKLQANSVVAGKIAANAIVAGDGVIGNAAIVNAQIADLNAAKINAGDIAAARMSTNIVTALEGKFATLSALAASLGVVSIQAGGALLTQGVTNYSSGTGLWAGETGGVYKLRVGNPAGARLDWDGSALRIYNAANQVTIASGELVGGVGTNMLPNSDLNSGIQNWFLSWNAGGGTNYSIEWDLSGIDWKPAGGHTVGFVRFGTTQAASSWFDIRYAVNIPVVSSRRYEFSAYVAAHRCTGYLLVIFYKLVAGVETYISETSFASTAAGGQSLASWGRVGGFMTAPADATYCSIILRGSAATSADPYVWGTRFYVGEAGAGQTTLSPWSAGGAGGRFAELSQITSANVSTYIANATIGTAQIIDANITTAKIADLQVGTIKIADSATTSLYTAAISGPVLTASVETTLATISSVVVPTNGYAIIELACGLDGPGTTSFRIYRDSTVIAIQSAIANTTVSLVANISAAGTYTITAKALTTATGVDLTPGSLHVVVYKK